MENEALRKNILQKQALEEDEEQLGDVFDDIQPLDDYSVASPKANQ